MITRLILLIAAASAIGCSSAPPPSPGITVIRDESQLDAAVGKPVRIEGIVANTKKPQLLGIAIEMEDVPVSGRFGVVRTIDPRGKRAWAEGILIRQLYHPELVVRGTDPRRLGAYYRLVDPLTGENPTAHLDE